MTSSLPGLPARPLTAEGFAPFGSVVQSSAEGRWINDGNSLRSEAGPLSLDQAAGRAVLAVFRARARDARGPWRELERHRLGTQTFLPMGEARCVLLVALGGNAPDPATLAAFVSRPGQGWTLSAGTWHHALIVMDDADVAVLERGAEAVDCDLAQLPLPVEITV